MQQTTAGVAETMSSGIYTKLSWLPAAPEDFAARCRIAVQGANADGEIRRLAGFALEQSQLSRLAKSLEQVKASGRPLQGMTSFRLGMLSNATIDFLVPALVGTAARFGISLEIVASDYDQAVQEALSPDSAVNSARPDAVLVAIDYRGLPLKSAPGDRESADSAVNSAMQLVKTISQGVRAHGGAPCLLQTLAAPPETIFGSMDRVVRGTLSRNISQFNAELGDFVAESENFLIDVARLAETVGLAEWHAPREWNLAKIPFSDECVPVYAEQVCRAMAAMRGKARRCLILDLDNTVWGGVIGDDGMEGIQIAEGDATGEAHRAVQRLALDLRQRGVVLAVCSKNEDAIARNAFQNHPEMLLREEHIAVFQANWNDKPANIRAIAEELSLGLESLVFLDDNPVERALVRQVLPEVAVPELPDDPALYARTLSAAGYFEAVTFSREDAERATFYQDNARRVSLQKQTSDLDSYLRSLNMEITFQRFDEVGRARIAQLINKSNQYNLTTKRYSEVQVAEISADARHFTLQVRLADIFGDNGMISVVICREELQGQWEIDTWLMSCRVLGRRVENMVLRHLLEQAAARGIAKLTGRYIPTERNRLVEDHYRRLGFVETRTDEAGRVEYELEVHGARVEEAPMTVVSEVA